uniref:rho guanine nucleotide exchange factor 17 isoform X2 n=1 Tax=Myxine glutinosa TaxID=7769 RepID=UPI00358DE3C6
MDSEKDNCGFQGKLYCTVYNKYIKSRVLSKTEDVQDAVKFEDQNMTTEKRAEHERQWTVNAKKMHPVSPSILRLSKPFLGPKEDERADERLVRGAAPDVGGDDDESQTAPRKVASKSRNDGSSSGYEPCSMTDAGWPSVAEIKARFLGEIESKQRRQHCSASLDSRRFLSVPERGTTATKLGRSMSLSPTPGPRVGWSQLERRWPVGARESNAKKYCKATVETSGESTGVIAQMPLSSSSLSSSHEDMLSYHAARSVIDQHMAVKGDPSHSENRNVEADFYPILNQNGQEQRPSRRQKSPPMESSVIDSDADGERDICRHSQIATEISSDSAEDKDSAGKNDVAASRLLIKEPSPQADQRVVSNEMPLENYSLCSISKSASSVSPVVSKVTKVSLQSFLPVTESHCSSTETLTDDDNGRTYWTFGSVGRMLSLESEEVLHNLGARPRPNLPFSIMTEKQMRFAKSGERAMTAFPHSRFFRKSMSNPDITSESAALLNILGPGASWLKAMKARESPGESEECEERLSLKSLTDTLRQQVLPSFKDAVNSNDLMSSVNCKNTLAKSVEEKLDVSVGVLRSKSICGDRVNDTDCSLGIKTDVGDIDAKSKSIISEEKLLLKEFMKERETSNTIPNIDGNEGKRSSWPRLHLEDLEEESSTTDEGIVTELEMATEVGYLSGSAVAHDLYKTDSWLWKKGPLANATQTHEAGMDSDTFHKGLGEIPLTYSGSRRRRKFCTLGNGALELSSSSGSGETGAEGLRSLSDPTPYRICPPNEESTFSLDSNLLWSLEQSHSGLGEGELTSVPDDCIVSDLSVCSDEGLRDYGTVIQSIVSYPCRDSSEEKGPGKTFKKSFSDPSRRGGSGDKEFVRVGAWSLGETISETEVAFPTSRSEPILAEQRSQECGATGNFGTAVQQEWTLSQSPMVEKSKEIDTVISRDDYCDVTKGLTFDPNLLSPCMVRRNSKKRGGRVVLERCQGSDNRDVSESSEDNSVHLSKTDRSPSIATASHAVEPVVSPDNLTSSQQLAELASCIPAKVYETREEKASLAEALQSSTHLSSPSLPDIKSDGSRAATEKGKSDKDKVDMRKHVMMNLLDTEHSYVESLRTLVQGYLRPLKQTENTGLCDPALVDDMFYQIPEILGHHEEFLDRVAGCVQCWHDRQTVGDLITESFSKDVLADSYVAYIDNFLNAKEAVRLAREAKPAFNKFLEHCMRENKEKQALADLMIKPVQRIPRYELLIKDLLKHTPEEHPDWASLSLAQRDVRLLAERINQGRRDAEEAERAVRVLQEVEAHIEGVSELVCPERRFLKQEIVTELGVGSKKDRSLFLFSDLFICTTLKKKSGTLRRSSVSLTGCIIDTSNKYKLLWRLPLDGVDIVRGADQAMSRESLQKVVNQLDNDLSTLSHIGALCEGLSIPHQILDEVVRELTSSVSSELTERQAALLNSPPAALPLPLPSRLKLLTSAAVPGGSAESYVFEFSGTDARATFENLLEEAKRKLMSLWNRWEPEFLKAIPIMKTRSGLQFSCAAPSMGLREHAAEVWVCNSDGFVGQVCLLSARLEPIVEACIAVCSSRILCISPVPSPAPRDSTTSSSSQLTSITKNLASESWPSVWHGGSDCCLVPLTETNPSLGQSLNPSGSDGEDSDNEDWSRVHSEEESSPYKETSVHDTWLDRSSSEDEQEDRSGPGLLSARSAFTPVRARDRSSGQTPQRSSRCSLQEGGAGLELEADSSSMWLGTEDGCIHIYQSSDNIRNRKNSLKLQHPAAITCIIYLEDKVFVSLANGDLIVYQRETGCFWTVERSVSVGSPGCPVTKLTAVAGRLWCSCQGKVLVIDPVLLHIEHTLDLAGDGSRGVACLVSAGLVVWVALQGSATLRLYHAHSFECLTEVDVAPPVHKMLAGADAIIRQHKAACLRVTALLVCKDLLWIGTSAGVILTLPQLHVAPKGGRGTGRQTPPSPLGPLNPTGLAYGHTGHVRFLTAIEVSDTSDLPASGSLIAGQTGTVYGKCINPHPRQQWQRKGSQRRRGASSSTRVMRTLIVSGGDGYEDFRMCGSSETAGRDDSTNHLLIWHI